jgi:hypothetical protein
MALFETIFHAAEAGIPLALGQTQVFHFTIPASPWGLALAEPLNPTVTNYVINNGVYSPSNAFYSSTAYVTATLFDPTGGTIITGHLPINAFGLSSLLNAAVRAGGVITYSLTNNIAGPTSWTFNPTLQLDYTSTASPPPVINPPTITPPGPVDPPTPVTVVINVDPTTTTIMVVDPTDPTHPIIVDPSHPVIVVDPAVTTTYTIIATGPGGTSMLPFTVTVNGSARCLCTWQEGVDPAANWTLGLLPACGWVKDGCP